ncbi:7-methylguanosine phosphate-specific 5'-nucleotidase A-like isoform X2 [Galleria mellonella]|nr:7-methylguanosine phosphate-specific 5'-nucleotidase A-like isoform X2 [Galleria mellonella]
MTVVLKDILPLNQQNVFISNEEQLLKKINSMKSDTYAKLQIVTDFDHTLTRPDGLTSFDMFNKCPSVPVEYVQVNEKLKKEYGDATKTVNMSDGEITEHYSQWFRKVYDELKAHIEKFPLSELDEQADKVKFRYGVENLIKTCEEKEVPILIFSAGMGECVDAVIKKNNLQSLPNIKIIANYCELDSNGKVLGVKGDFLMHSRNKNEAIKHYVKLDEHFKEMEKRRNVILMGDMTGDVGMVTDESCNIIKIGFLSLNGKQNIEETEKNKKKYLDVFDIVLLNENTMDVPNAILNIINNAY